MVAALEQIRDEWMDAQGFESAAEINDGFCDGWAEEAQAKVGGEIVWLDNNGHVGGYEHAVLVLDGRYYDAERCNGVTNTAALPWVRRNNDNARSAEAYGI